MSNAHRSCGGCHKNIEDSTDIGIAVTCDGACRQAFHLSCTDLPGSFLDALRANIGLRWFCRTCRLVQQLQESTPPPTTVAASRESAGPSRDVAVQENVTSKMAKIFGGVLRYLSVRDVRSLRLACKEWRFAVDNSPSIEQRVKLELSAIIDKDFRPVSLPRVAQISLDKCTIYDIGPGGWSTLFGVSLTHLQVSLRCRVSVATLLQMLWQSPNLSNLNMSCGPTLIYDPAVDKISNFRLEKMQILELHHETTDLLPLFGKIFPLLKNLTLKIDESDEMDENGRMQSGLHSRMLAEHFVNFPQLKRLSFYCENCCEEESTISLRSFNLEHLTALERLDIKIFDVPLMGPTPLSFAGVKAPQLVELHLSGVAVTQSDMLVEFLGSAINLRTIELNDCELNKWSDLFVPVHSKNWQHLKLSSVHVQQAKRECVDEMFDELQSLSLKHCDMSKQTMLSLFRKCPRLKKLYCDEGSFDDDLILSIRQEMKKLQHLKLFLKKFTNYGALHIINQGNKLKRLIICTEEPIRLTEDVKAQLRTVASIKCKIHRRQRKWYEM